MAPPCLRPPCHPSAAQGLLFFTGVWTTIIHDTVLARTEPIMGSGYHTLHHTTYKNNYGQFFTFMDWVHGTLDVPYLDAAGNLRSSRYASAHLNEDGTTPAASAGPAAAAKKLHSE
jgi:sterol desaturase/sphingolipid hydroxylase (fatty acid hydroxylase superfamily)